MKKDCRKNTFVDKFCISEIIRCFDFMAWRMQTGVDWQQCPMAPELSAQPPPSYSGSSFSKTFQRQRIATVGGYNERCWCRSPVTRRKIMVPNNRSWSSRPKKYQFNDDCSTGKRHRFLMMGCRLVFQVRYVANKIIRNNDAGWN